MEDAIEVCSGKRFKVVMTAAVHKQFCYAEAKERARCLKWMKFCADDGHDHLDKGKFRFEARLPAGDKKGTQIAIYAFKAWQLRVYGSFVGTTFVATEIDIAKKANVADPRILRSAAKKLAPFLVDAAGGKK